jgi:hypothetical protein
MRLVGVSLLCEHAAGWFGRSDDATVTGHEAKEVTIFGIYMFLH